MYQLPESLRHELKKPFGTVTTGPLEPHLDHDTLATVGDVVTRDALEEGLAPALMVVDGKTQRTREAPTVQAPGKARRITVENPPAQITEELWGAIEDAYESQPPTFIQVEGEEDLATLPAIVHAPDGAHVVYGQPDEGAVVVTVDQITRERADDVLAQMEVV